MWHRAESVGAQAAACAAAGWTCRAIVAQASPPPQLHPPGDPTSAPALAVETMEIGGNGMGVALNEWLVRTAKPDAARAQGEAVGGAQTSHDGSAARAEDANDDANDDVIMWLDSRDFLLHENIAHEVSL